MTLRLNGSTSGYTEIDAPAVAASNTLVLPTGNGSADQALVTNGSGTLSFADRGRMVLETAQSSTSGTSIDFTSIPSWVKRVTVMFSGVSISGTSSILIQLGTTSGFETTGYQSNSQTVSDAPQVTNIASTAGIIVRAGSATVVFVGSLSINKLSGNTFVSNGLFHRTDATTLLVHSAGGKALSGTLDRVRITTVNGTDTFDAGSINILYEG
jgi:hypothetical protein